MKLNLGCGAHKLAGWVNVDKFAACAPDAVVDLEVLPWPWEDDSVEEMLLSHVLEHLGAATDSYLGIVREMYRVCRDGARVTIVVPHPRHDFFLNDPTHVRPITPEGLQMFDLALNLEWRKQGFANTPLGLYLGVDFAIVELDHRLDPAWKAKLERGEIAAAQLPELARTYNNVIEETKIVLTARKQAGAAPS